jgi:hypothetical protein
MEFRYVNIPPEQSDAAGGDVEFIRMANGAWAISRWNIRMPAMEQRVASNYYGGNSVRVAEIHTAGGELVLARRGTDTLWSRPPLTLAGIVRDSISGAGVGGARVAIDGTDLGGTTDARGQFTIANVLPGEYTIDVRTASLDSLSALHRSSLAFTGAESPAEIRVPTASQVRATVCGAAHPDLRIQREVACGAVLTGVVLVDSTQQPVIGAEVSIPDASKTVLTDERGAFKLSGIPAGTHRLVVRRIGYGVLDTPVEFALNHTVDRRVFLSRVTTLDSVRVTATLHDNLMRDFEDNRRLGLGHFFTREEMEAREGRSTSSVLAEFPGIIIVSGKGSHAWVRSGRFPVGVLATPQLMDVANGAQAASCYAQVWVDGARVFRNAKDGKRFIEPLFDVNSIPPERIEAIEYYAGPSQTPARYSGLDSSCGVLVIWTRRGP